VLQRVKNEIARAVSVPGIYTHVLRTQGPGRRRQTTRAASRSRLHIRHGAAPFVRSVRQSSQPGRQAQPDRASTMCKPPLLQHCRFSLSLSLCRATYERETTRRPSVALSANALRAFSHHTQNSPRAHTQYITARAAPHMPDFRPNPGPFSTFFALNCKFLGLCPSDSDFEPLHCVLWHVMVFKFVI
jgi:hypothetical protein